MYPKKFLYNTAISVQQPYIAGHSLRQKIYLHCIDINAGHCYESLLFFLCANFEIFFSILTFFIGKYLQIYGKFPIFYYKLIFKCLTDSPPFGNEDCKGRL